MLKFSKLLTVSNVTQSLSCMVTNLEVVVKTQANELDKQLCISEAADTAAQIAENEIKAAKVVAAKIKALIE